MRKIFLLILVLLLAPQLAAAYEVLILQGQRSPGYDEAVRGFQSVCSARSRILVLADYAETDVGRVVREDRPRLVVTVGDNALASVQKIRQTPVVALMTTGLQGIDRARSNVTGIDLFVPPERYLPLFAALKGKRIGLIYDPMKSGGYVRHASGVMEDAGMNLVGKEAHSPKEVVTLLAGLKDKSDLLWVIPDRTIVVRETLEAFFHFSREQFVPLVSFSASHLGYGAAAVLDIDRTELGRQAGEMALAILKGQSPSEIAIASPRKAVMKTNPAVLGRLGLAAGISTRPPQAK